MLEEKEIRNIFKTLRLQDESERQRMLSQGVVGSKIEHKDINYIIVDNVTTPDEEEESKNA